MELYKIEIILEKYFEGRTTIVEENELRTYFSSPEVAQHLIQYKSMFGFFVEAKAAQLQQLKPFLQKKSNKKPYLIGLSIAASVVVLLGIGFFDYYNKQTITQDLGTYDNPEVAFKATQKALTLLSNNVNVGVKSVQYIGEYENSKNFIFKK